MKEMINKNIEMTASLIFEIEKKEQCKFNKNCKLENEIKKYIKMIVLVNGFWVVGDYQYG